jgi:DNA-binding CsgD family transcriptional regulator
MVTLADIQKLNDATLALYAPGLSLSGYPEAAFSFLSSLISADQINYAKLDPQKGSMDMATSFMTPDWAVGVEGFGRYMWKYPMTNFDPSVNDGKPFFSSDFLSLRQFRDLDIYSECFKILGMDHHAALHVPTVDGKILWFGLERAGARAFTERDRLMLTLAQPHLSNTLQLLQARQLTRSELQLLPESFCKCGFNSKESEVAYWLTEGKSNAEIGLLMNLHVQTVKGYVTALFNRTGVGNRLALTLHLMDLASSLQGAHPHLHRITTQKERQE